MCGLLIAAEIDKLVAVADNGFPLLFKQGFQLCHVLQNDADADSSGTHNGKNLIKVIRQRNVCKFVHQEMHRNRQTSAMLGIRRGKQRLKQLRIENRHQKIEAGVVIRQNGKQSGLFLPDAGQLQFIVFRHSGKTVEVEFLQSRRQRNLYRFQRFGRAGSVRLVILHGDVVGVLALQFGE